jgi:NADH dehydrogenase FAD-containing subunit
MKERPQRPRVVIIGGGFGGLYAAKALANEAVEVTLIDRKNHHIFQPLLYQVALGVLSPGEITASLRHILRKSRNVHTILGEVTEFDTTARRVKLIDGAEITYDYLIIGAGPLDSSRAHGKSTVHTRRTASRQRIRINSTPTFLTFSTKRERRVSLKPAISTGDLLLNDIVAS